MKFPSGQITTSPQSTINGSHAFPSPSASLGTRSVNGLYKYQPFSAATAARTRASSRLPPVPSPNLSRPEKMPTMKTGCRVRRPVSLRMRAVGFSSPSRAQSRDKSRVGILKSNILEKSRWRETMCSLKKSLVAFLPQWR